MVSGKSLNRTHLPTSYVERLRFNKDESVMQRTFDSLSGKKQTLDVLASVTTPKVSSGPVVHPDTTTQAAKAMDAKRSFIDQQPGRSM